MQRNDNHVQELLLQIIEGQKRLEGRQERLEEGQKEIKTDVRGLKTDVSELKIGQKELEKGQRLIIIKLDSHIEQSKIDHSGLTDSILGLNDILDKRVTRLEKNAGLPPLR